ncbi:alpha/beta fold hydrolase [Ramlibacter sp. USB13]|uniref:Proline iminopeptidase n=1 Tax=Ramlibacter cellulosilyticus TaxID=2764187 RepID=A0A923MU93_9BURK|nr:alpha/beta fold hydrolase [Ramlibacter cellulosilyticus]MBC5784754.1 alpha/beta fold hydrolase [Ramlibacter cellulosilyticus]
MSFRAPSSELSAPCRSGRLAVGEGHAIAWQVSGPEQAPALLLLHGGPGSAWSSRLADAFDAFGLRIVGFDQRGCGESTPRGETRANDTQRLVADIERLRSTLEVRRWLVAGGSWGGTLALAYAGQHPAAVAGLLLRNLFVPDAASLDWFFRGASARFPRAWAEFVSVLPPDAHRAPLQGFAHLFADGSDDEQAAAARAWVAWEQVLSGAAPQPLPPASARAAVDRCRIQVHYLLRQCWLGREGVAEAARAVARLPVEFVHGAEDLVCRPAAARELQQLLPRSRFTEVAGAGHDPFHPAMVQAARAALDRLLAATEARRP